MRWIRKRALLTASLLIIYFVVVHARQNGNAVIVATFASAAFVIGSAFFDRLLFDPSAIFVKKPWRMMQPSAGDLFRLTMLGAVSAMIFPLVILRGSYMSDAAIIEGGLFALALFFYELMRYQIERVRWHGKVLQVRSRFGRSVTLKWPELKRIYLSGFGEYLTFEDQSGRTARVSRRSKGFSEFMRDAERYAPAALMSDVRRLK